MSRRIATATGQTVWRRGAGGTALFCKLTSKFRKQILPSTIASCSPGWLPVRQLVAVRVFIADFRYTRLKYYHRGLPIDELMVAPATAMTIRIRPTMVHLLATGRRVDMINK